MCLKLSIAAHGNSKSLDYDDCCSEFIAFINVRYDVDEVDLIQAEFLPHRTRAEVTKKLVVFFQSNIKNMALA
jgi:hypothetical protein